MKQKLLTNEELGAALMKSPAERVTKEYIESRITSAEFTKLGETVTLCNIVIDNGFSVRGESACVNPENYNRAIGERVAHDQAFGKLWAFFGFLLAETGHQKKLLDAANEKMAGCEKVAE